MPERHQIKCDIFLIVSKVNGSLAGVEGSARALCASEVTGNGPRSATFLDFLQLSTQQ